MDDSQAEADIASTSLLCHKNTYYLEYNEFYALVLFFENLSLWFSLLSKQFFWQVLPHVYSLPIAIMAYSDSFRKTVVDLQLVFHHWAFILYAFLSLNSESNPINLSWMFAQKCKMLSLDYFFILVLEHEREKCVW